MQFRNAKFATSAANTKGYPKLVDKKGHLLPEIAVAGRSNVGKSSLLNHLFQTKGLVKTSATPGKTQLINFFTVDDKLAFVDLPGYGYAAVPLPLKQKWGPMIQDYLTQREQLKLILFLFDIRRIPNQDDLQLLEWIIHANKAVILVFTKVDKVTRNEKVANTKQILEAFGVGLQYVCTSALKNQGRGELAGMIQEALQEEEGE